MKVVILCGGKGTRLREETEYRPKPMVPIGGRPILWHIMKIYAIHGHSDFILCLGYKGDMIRDYFRNYQLYSSDTTLTLGRNPKTVFHQRYDEESWKVTLAETGENSLTAYRIRQIKKYIGRDKTFLLTYGDGVGRVDIAASIRQHVKSDAVCTVTAVHPPGRFGELSVDSLRRVHAFNEKPQAEGGYINGGFMVCDRSIFDYIPDDPGMMLEQAPMKNLARDGKLSAYNHEGFWQPMDTYQEFSLLNRMWEAGAPRGNFGKPMFGGYYDGRRVLVTGHTGFKGSWLCEWLLEMGAVVGGYSLAPTTDPALFDLLHLKGRLSRHVEADIRDLDSVSSAVEAFRPEVLFHLAAQPLVRDSYDRPVDTYAVNVMGTVNILEALRRSGQPCNTVFVTTDKCYENREWVHSYREEDPMGGWDPYSSSKGCAELVINAYRRSFFSAANSPIRVASARAGNVIGGGDWAKDRILPDCIRSLRRRDEIAVRNRLATRPWQHVLEPLSGYLLLASLLATERPAGALLSAFNFGPSLHSNRTVEDLVVEVIRHWPGKWVDHSDPKAVHEAKLLNLATDKAHHYLGWSPVWSFEDSVAQSVQWYLANENQPGSVDAFTRRQLLEYVASAKKLNLTWSN